MSEVIKDCSFKLFGKMIGLLPEKRQCSSSTSNSVDTTTTKDESGLEFTGSTTTQSNDPRDESLSSDQSASASESEEKTVVLKKPDEIIPCPRCKSMETKFCYYNNYNVNQPRYFCKKCQRYWTSGGTMRNVPIGSGRRKNKSPNYNQAVLMDRESSCMNGFFIFGSQNDHPGPSSSSSGFPVTFYPWAFSSSLGKHKREETDQSHPKRYNWSAAHRNTNDQDTSSSSSSSLMVLQANPAASSRSLNFHETA